MKKIIAWIKENWTDPVWSKVFSAVIILILGNFGLLLLSLLKRIPFQQIISDIAEYSIKTSFTINLFTIVLISFGLLVTVIPMILLKIVSFQLKNLKFPASLTNKKINLQAFVSTKWILNFDNWSANHRGQESLTIKEGNKYYINGRLEFILTDIKFNDLDNQIIWTKTRYPKNRKHSTETLRIENDNIISGNDDLGYSLRYVKNSSHGG